MVAVSADVPVLRMNSVSRMRSLMTRLAENATSLRIRLFSYAMPQAPLAWLM
jgi:hypothetical protein